MKKIVYGLAACCLTFVIGCGGANETPAVSSNPASENQDSSHQPASPSGAGDRQTVLKPPASDIVLKGSGATFINVMMQTWCSAYGAAGKGSVVYQSLGSGKGIENMTNKTSHFGCSDNPMNAEQLEKARQSGGEPIHVPLVLGCDVPGYNLPSLKETLKVSGPVLADIYLGKITRWNDPALVALNPGQELPDLEILVAYRSDKSGTTYVWTDYLTKVSEEWKERVGYSQDPKWPHGAGYKGNEGVAGFVNRTEGAIGYVELSYAMISGLKYAQVLNREGQFVEASLQTVTAAAAGLLQEIPDDLCFSLTNAAGQDAYPISSASWAIVYAQQQPGEGEAVIRFLDWCLSDGQALCEAVHYAPLPVGLAQKSREKLKTIAIR